VRFLKWFYKKKNYNNEEYIALLDDKGMDVKVLPESYYFNLKNKLAIESSAIPSTGLIALYYFLTTPLFKGVPIYLYGFEFKGWAGHPWKKEQKFVENLLLKDRVHLLTN